METKLFYKTLETIYSIVQKHISDPFKLFLFGSRAKGHYKKFSDIDLTILCPKKLPDEIVSAIKSDFEFSDLAYSVDFIDYQSIDNPFKLCIKDDLKLIFEQK